MRLPEVTTVLSVQVVSTGVGTAVTEVEYVGAGAVALARWGCPSTNSEHIGPTGTVELLDTGATGLDAGGTKVDDP